MKPSGAHTHPDTNSGIAIAAVIAAVFAASVAVPVIHALTGLLETVLITALVCLALAITALSAFLVIYLRRNRLRPPGQPFAVRAHTTRSPLTAAANHRPALGQAAPAVHLHLHGVTADDIAHALANHPITRNGG